MKIRLIGSSWVSALARAPGTIHQRNNWLKEPQETQKETIRLTTYGH
jgi:hypothetical protein